MSCRHEEPDPFPAPCGGRLTFTIAARTDPGRERPNNEDRAAFADAGSGHAWGAPADAALAAPRALFALVCDGMGGENGGEIASAVAVESIVSAMHQHVRAGTAVDEIALAGMLRSSIEGAGDRIRAIARMEPHLERMGTTATLAAMTDDALFCAQVGDSRAYLLRSGVLSQLTRDQTLAEMIRRESARFEGIDPEAYGTHVILQAVGSSTRLDIPVTRTPLEAGDVILLCSDGLSGPVRDAEIASILSAHPDPAVACDALVAAANANGGPDNVTCVVVRVGQLTTR
jgi:PPM family protein phosphatase